MVKIINNKMTKRFKKKVNKIYFLREGHFEAICSPIPPFAKVIYYEKDIQMESYFNGTNMSIKQIINRSKLKNMLSDVAFSYTSVFSSLFLS